MSGACCPECLLTTVFLFSLPLSSPGQPLLQRRVSARCVISSTLCYLERGSGVPPPTESYGSVLTDKQTCSVAREPSRTPGTSPPDPDTVSPSPAPSPPLLLSHFCGLPLSPAPCSCTRWSGRCGHRRRGLRKCPRIARAGAGEAGMPGRATRGSPGQAAGAGVESAGA